jgi:hypothetical protein
METLDPISPAGYAEVCVYGTIVKLLSSLFSVLYEPLRDSLSEKLLSYLVQKTGRRKLHSTYWYNPSDEQYWVRTVVSSECELFVTPRMFYFCSRKIRVPGAQS